MIDIPPSIAPKVAPLQILPIWEECSFCTRFSRCNDPYPPYGRCPHPNDHILSPQKHATLRFPRWWAMYEASLQEDPELASVFLRWQKGRSILEADFLTMRAKAIAAGVTIEPGPRWLIWEILDDDLRFLHGDFCTYYGLPDERVAWALQAAFNLVLVTAIEDLVLGATRLGGDWVRYMVDNIRAGLWGLLQLKYLNLDHLHDKEFRHTFEQEWEKLLPFRGQRFDFCVIPRLGWNDFVRYQRLPQGDATIRSILSGYMAHQAMVYPHLLKVVSPLFAEVVFVQRLRVMYEPLLLTMVQRAAKHLGLARHQIQEREDIREGLQQEFDRSFQEFEFYWRPKNQGRPFGTQGILGLTEDTALREQIDAVLEQKGTSLRTQDMAVYAFAHYINVRLRHWIDKSYPADLQQPHTVSLNDCHPQKGEDVGRERLETIEESEPWPLNAGAYVGEEPDLQGPDGQPYMMIRQAARRYSLSEDQLRRMDKAGSLPAQRAGDVFGADSLVPPNTRLYPLSPEADQAARIATLRAQTHSSQLTGQELNRKQAANYLQAKEKVLRDLEISGKIQPHRKGKSVVYTQDTLNQAQAVLDERAERVRVRQQMRQIQRPHAQ